MDLKELNAHEFRGKEQEGDLCPECLDGKLVLRENRNNFSQFLGCERYPDCKYTISKT